MIKAIIFDYFGVIRPDVLYATYDQLGGDSVADRNFIEDTVHASHHGFIASSSQVLAERLGVPVKKYTEVLNENMGGNDQALLKFIAELKRCYKVGLLSNIGRGKVEELLEPDELRLFDATVLSGNIGFAKPEAEAYEAIAVQLDVRLDECVFTDDHEEFCDGARAVGMQAIAYVSLKQFQADLHALLAKQ